MHFPRQHSHPGSAESSACDLPAGATMRLPIPLAGRAPATCPETPVPLTPRRERSSALVVVSHPQETLKVPEFSVLLSAPAGWALSEFSPSVVTPGPACAVPTGRCLHRAHCELFELGQSSPVRGLVSPLPTLPLI